LATSYSSGHLGYFQGPSCNPFRRRELKGVNLGDIAKKCWDIGKEQLKEKQIPLSTIKWVSETGAKEESVGFTFKDFERFTDKSIWIRKMVLKN